MTDNQLSLARRLVAAPWWEWRVGMSPIEVRGDKIIVWGTVSHEDLDDPMDGLHCGVPPSQHCIPDLDDDATCGILLAMLVETHQATGVRYMHVNTGGDEWEWMWEVCLYDSEPDGSRAFYAPELGEALTRALLQVRGET